MRVPRLNLTEDQTRNLILEEADRLFTEIGYDKTTVADIARACGFSSSNVHRVFGTKSVINRSIAERKMQELLSGALAAAEKHETAAKRLEVFYKAIHENTYNMWTEHKRVHDMVAAAIDERWEEVQRYRLGLLNSVRSIIVYGIERGEFRVENIDRTARAVHISGIRYCHPLAVAEMQDEPDDPDFQGWLEFVLRGLCAKP